MLKMEPWATPEFGRPEGMKLAEFRTPPAVIEGCAVADAEQRKRSKGRVA